MRKSQSNFNVKLSTSFKSYLMVQNFVESSKIAIKPSLLIGVVGFFEPLIKLKDMSEILSTSFVVYSRNGTIYFLIMFLLIWALNFIYLSFFKTPILFSPINVNLVNQLLLQPVGKKLIICHLKKPLDKEQVMAWQQKTGRYLHETIFESRDDIHMLDSIAVLSETDRQRLKQVRLY